MGIQDRRNVDTLTNDKLLRSDGPQYDPEKDLRIFQRTDGVYDVLN